jgi:hypothetical protein
VKSPKYHATYTSKPIDSDIQNHLHAIAKPSAWGRVPQCVGKKNGINDFLPKERFL